MTDQAGTLTVRHAVAADAERVVEVISEAFLHDPTWSWALPDPASRKRLWRLSVDGALRYPWILHTPAFEAVALWIPPGGTEFTPEVEAGIPDFLRETVGPRAGDVEELLARFGAAHPRHEPHYYLGLLATADAHRGRGLGMTLLRENLARMDREGIPSYLESSNPANNQRYQSVGFVPVVSFRAPGDGPLVTGMWRAAGAHRHP